MSALDELDDCEITASKEDTNGFAKIPNLIETNEVPIIVNSNILVKWAQTDLINSCGLNADQRREFLFQNIWGATACSSSYVHERRHQHHTHQRTSIQNHTHIQKLNSIPYVIFIYIMVYIWIIECNWVKKEFIIWKYWHRPKELRHYR